MLFHTQPISEIFTVLKKALQNRTQTTFTVLDPDLFRGTYAGTEVTVEGTLYTYRSLRAWMELAELLDCRMLVPQKAGSAHLEITLEKLGRDSFHKTLASPEEKYGSSSLFSRIHKMEEPAFYCYYEEALYHAKITERTRILDLGINRGDEFEVIRKILAPSRYTSVELVGIDHSKSAIDEAHRHFHETNVSFFTSDINRLDELNLGTFDLLVSIGTLQSPSIRFKPMLMHLVQNYLMEDAALVLGFPNSRWKDGEMVYGAKAAHYSFSEMGVVLEDILFAKKYLQQKKYRVMITGKQYLFLTAVRIGQKKSSPEQ